MENEPGERSQLLVPYTHLISISLKIMAEYFYHHAMI